MSFFSAFVDELAKLGFSEDPLLERHERPLRQIAALRRSQGRTPRFKAPSGEVIGTPSATSGTTVARTGRKYEQILSRAKKGLRFKA